MKIVLQRVSAATVSVDNNVVGNIGAGYVLLIGFGQSDTLESIKPLVEKIVNLRVFPDEQGRFQHSLLEIKGDVLLVPNFTLYGDTTKGRRPDFFDAMQPSDAMKLFGALPEVFLSLGIENVERGVFGAYMHVKLVNDGPVTLVFEG